jgi:hypothetical protein
MYNIIMENQPLSGSEQKIQEYIDRIKKGESKEKTLEGLSPSFINAVEKGLQKEDSKETSPKEQPLIPPQWKGLKAEALAEIWVVPYYTDDKKTEEELSIRRNAILFLQSKEREEDERKIIKDKEIEKIKKDLKVENNESEKSTKQETLETKDVYEKSLDSVLEQLKKEKGIVELKDNVPTIIVSDLHARKDFLEKVLALKSGGDKSAIDLIREGKINIVCMGDGMHSELASNWTTTKVPYELSKLISNNGPMKDQLEQYKKIIETAGGKKYEDMTPMEIYASIRNQNAKDYFSSIEAKIKESLLEEEMARSFGLMKMVMDLKSKYPENFHYVRGNHDDIKETLKGFEKYDSESARVKKWTMDNFGGDFLDKYAEFEASLPLLAKGKDFVISHTAPSKVLEVENINNRDKQTSISLTWTNNLNGETSEDVIDQTLKNLGMKDTRWFIGHRGVDNGNVREQFNKKLIQINHDEKELIAIIGDGKNYSSDQVYDLNK